MAGWPKHSDGRPKKMGEMTHEERVAQWKDAVERLKPEIERMGASLEWGGVTPSKSRGH